MRTKKKDKPTAPPLAATLRAALASDWRTLAALDTLAGGARGSDARRLVHEALRALRGEGCVLEERVGRAGVEVRLAPAVVDAEAVEQAKLRAGIDEAYALDRAALDFLPHEAEPIADPGPIPGVRYGLSSEQIAEMGGPEGVEAIFAETDGEPMDIDAFQARAEAYLEAAAPAPPVGQAAPVEAVDGPVAPQPGPSSRCATCGAAYKRHDEGGATKHVPGTCAAFKALLRGRPRVAPVAPPLDAAPTAADVLAEIGTPLSRERLDAVRAWASEGATEPETSRGGSDGLDAGTIDAIREVIDTAPPSVRERVRARRKAAETSRGEAPGEQDHATCDTDTTRPSGSSRVPALRVATPRAPGKPRVPRPRAHPVPSADGVDQSASRVGAKDVATAGDVAPPCRPPLCHADDINEPARVRGFARPLCEAHRRWVEGAGGTLAASEAERERNTATQRARVESWDHIEALAEGRVDPTEETV